MLKQFSTSIGIFQFFKLHGVQAFCLNNKWLHPIDGIQRAVIFGKNPSVFWASRLLCAQPNIFYRLKIKETELRRSDKIVNGDILKISSNIHDKFAFFQRIHFAETNMSIKVVCLHYCSICCATFSGLWTLHSLKNTVSDTPKNL